MVFPRIIDLLCTTLFVTFLLCTRSSGYIVVLPLLMTIFRDYYIVPYQTTILFILYCFIVYTILNYLTIL